MVMLRKCAACGRWLNSGEPSCPSCGAGNPYYAEEDYSVSEPGNLQELRKYCAERHLPLDRLGIDLSGENKRPGTLGIQQVGKRFLVCRVGEDGSRESLAGPAGETAAVKELWTRLLDACHESELFPEGAPIQIDEEELALADENNGKVRVWLFLVGILFFPVLFVLAVYTLLLDLVPYFLYYRWLKPKNWHFCRDPGKDRDALRERLSRKELGAYFSGMLRWGSPKEPNLRERRFLDKQWFRFLPKLLRVLCIALLVLAILLSVSAIQHLNDGYYTDGGDLLYYRWHDSWFCLPVDRTDAKHWGYAGESRRVPEGLERLGRTWQPEWGGTDFTRSIDYLVLEDERLF